MMSCPTAFCPVLSCYLVCHSFSSAALFIHPLRLVEGLQPAKHYQIKQPATDWVTLPFGINQILNFSLQPKRNLNQKSSYKTMLRLTSL